MHHDPRVALAIAAAVPCDPRTVRAWLGGREPRSQYLRAQLTAAAVALGIERALPSASREAA